MTGTRNAIKTFQDKQKKSYDYKIRGAHLLPGDRVLVKVMAFDGRHKLVDKWTDEVYTVVRQVNQEVPVFDVQREDGQGKIRTLHRNLLLPIGSLNEEFPTSDVEVPRPIPPVPTPRKRPVPAPRKGKYSPRKTNGDDILVEKPDRFSESESEDELFIPTVTECSIPPDADTHSHDSLEGDILPEHPGDGHGFVQGDPDVSHSGDAHTSDNVEGDTSEVHVVDESTSDTIISDDSTPTVQHPAEERREDEEELPRRSGRARRQPQWMTSGEYVLSQQVEDPEWHKRASFLTNLTTEGRIPMDNTVRDAILTLILNK